jgi:ABC-2 type transporter
VAGEPVPGQPGYLFKGAWFGEEVRGARDDLQACLARQLAQCFPVELDDHGVPCPGDQQGRLVDRPQVRACEVGAATAGDDRCYRAGPLGGRHQRGRGARAGAEQPDRQASRGPVVQHPVGQGGQPRREQVDVEPEPAGPRVQLLFPGGEQVGQDGGQAGGLQFVGHVAIAWAVPAAAAAVREQHDSTLRLGWAAYGAHVPGRTALALAVTVAIGAASFCCLGYALTSLIRNEDAALPTTTAITLPLYFISGVFVAVTVLPHWLADVGEIFPVRHLAGALLVAYNPHTTGLGFAGRDLMIVAAWGAAGLAIALRTFSWLPLGR